VARIAGNQSNDDRNPTDYYPTDPRWIEALLKVHSPPGPVWEPACGQGHIVGVLRAHGYEVRATDILTGDDSLLASEPFQGSIVTNPPYRHADCFIEKALALAAGTVAMLLPLGYLGGARRTQRIWAAQPPTLALVVPQRMCVNGQASQFSHCWAVWERGLADDPRRKPILDWQSI
jgi:hypothetical protein